MPIQGLLRVVLAECRKGPNNISELLKYCRQSCILQPPVPSPQILDGNRLRKTVIFSLIQLNKDVQGLWFYMAEQYHCLKQQQTPRETNVIFLKRILLNQVNLYELLTLFRAEFIHILSFCWLFSLQLISIPLVVKGKYAFYRKTQ